MNPLKSLRKDGHLERKEPTVLCSSHTQLLRVPSPGHLIDFQCLSPTLLLGNAYLHLSFASFKFICCLLCNPSSHTRLLHPQTDVTAHFSVLPQQLFINLSPPFIRDLLHKRFYLILFIFGRQSKLVGKNMDSGVRRFGSNYCFLHLLAV